MPISPYPIPAKARQRSMSEELSNTHQAVLFAHLHRTIVPAGGLMVPVVLLADFRTGGLKVKWDYGIIGSLSAEFRHQFPSIDAILASGKNPQTQAKLEFHEGKVRAYVFVADNSLLIPANNPPDQPWTLVTEGSAHPYPISISNPDVLAPYSDRQILCPAHSGDDPHSLSLWCEGEYLGKIEGLAPELHELVTHYETLGLVSVIRCYVSEDGTAATAELLAPEEISEAVLEPPVSPIPTTDLPYPQSSATGTESNAAEHGGASSPDSEGNWSLRLPSSRFFAPTPEQIREHKEKIRVKSPSLPESSAPSEATTMFQAQPKQQPVVGVGSYQQRDNHPEPQPDSSASGSSRSWWWLLAILVLILLASTLFILSRF